MGAKLRFASMLTGNIIVYSASSWQIRPFFRPSVSPCVSVRHTLLVWSNRRKLGSWSLQHLIAKYNSFCAVSCVHPGRPIRKEHLKPRHQLKVRQEKLRFSAFIWAVRDKTTVTINR